jgi:hypothetical protein
MFNGVGGAAAWSRIAPSDMYRPLSPGNQEITITMAGATAASYASASGDIRWERPW